MAKLKSFGYCFDSTKLGLEKIGIIIQINYTNYLCCVRILEID